MPVPFVAARRFVATILAVVAVVAGLVAVQGSWLQATVLDTDGYLDAVARPLGDDPAVKDALATELANQVVAGVNLSTVLQDLVPPASRAAVADAGRRIEQQWRSEMQPNIRRQFDAPGFAPLWEQANAAAQRQLVDALADRRVGSEVVVDLHGVLVSAIGEVGVAIDRDLRLPMNIATDIFAGIARALPAEVGRTVIDLSRVGPGERFVVRNASTVVAGAGLGAVVAALGALAIADRRARGVMLALMGALLAAGVAGLGWISAMGATNAGARVRGAGGVPLTAEMRVVVDAQARLVADSMAGWLGATAGVGALSAVLGIVVTVVVGRRRQTPPSVYPGVYPGGY